jgi:thiol-disulfide isomerase/thioredoxin
LKSIILMLLAVMLISLPGFAKAPAVVPGPDQLPQITFVELGSVNCMPCKMMQPVMRAIEDDYSGSVKVVFHDVSKSDGRPFAEKYGIQAIPTQIFLDNTGKEFFRHTGFFPKEEIVKVLKKQGVKKVASPVPLQKTKQADGTTCPVGSVCK